jgi:hypothetical protein
MRVRSFIVSALLLGCGEVKHVPTDAPGGDGAAPDAPACPRTLLLGGTLVEPQGWSVVMQQPANLSYGPDYVRLDTSTPPGASTSGQLLLSYPGALPPPPFRFQVVLLVERVSPHNGSDAAAAIMASFSPPFGAGNDRAQMIYLDGGSIGWADDTQAFTTTVVNNTYHTVEVAVDASTTARVKIDGIAALTRSGFVSNGALTRRPDPADHAARRRSRSRTSVSICAVPGIRSNGSITSGTQPAAPSSTRSRASDSGPQLT